MTFEANDEVDDIELQVEVDDIGEVELEDDAVGDELKEEQQEKQEEKPEEYSKKVQKRINKIVKERNLERAQRLKEKEDFERKLAEQEERFKAFEERFTMRERETESASIDSQISALKRRKVELYDSGDFEALSDVDDQIIELRLKKERQPTREPATRQEPPASSNERQVQHQEAPEIPEAQQAWMERNDWFFNPAKTAQRKKADDIYILLTNEGYDPDDDELYAELDRRMSQKPRQTVASPDRGSAVGNARGNKPVFTRNDLERMIEWGIPDTAENRAEWLRNKRSSS